MNNQLFHLTNLLSETNQAIIDLLSKEEILLKKLKQIEIMPAVDKANLNHLLWLTQSENKRRKEIKETYQEFKELQKPDLGFLYHSKNQALYLGEWQKALTSFTEIKNIKAIIFTIDDLDVENQMVHGTCFYRGQMKDVLASIPPFIYNLGKYVSLLNLKKIKSLRKMDCITLINPLNRFNQMFIFELLNSLPESKRFLLPIHPLSESQLKESFLKTNIILCLPQRTVTNDKILKIVKGGSKFTIYHGNQTLESNDNKLWIDVRKIMNNRKYFLMHGIDTLEYNGIPLEVRVYHQKNGNKKWEAVSLLSKTEGFSKGSLYHREAQLLSTVFTRYKALDYSQTEKKLIDYTATATNYLEFFLSNIGTLYFDYIFDRNGNPYLIYVGGYEQADFLYQIKHSEHWKHYIENTILYLATFIEKEE